MFDGLLLHPRTRAQLDDFIANPVHGLILTGPEGAGRQSVAQVVAATLLQLKTIDQLASYPYYAHINPEAAVITIDEIRMLQGLLRLKTPQRDGQTIRRILVVINAGRMRSEAQNAFLKSLEEPPEDTVIIMTAEGSHDMLATIYSRLQRIEILPISQPPAQEFYKQQAISGHSFAAAYALSQGQAGLLHALLHDEAGALKESVDTAKGLLSMAAGERLLKIDELSKDKNGVVLLINALGRIAHAALRSASQTGNIKLVSRWQANMKLIEQARQTLRYNANQKLVLDQLLLNL
jgi:DNA polymerase-3 subunit delta'